MSGADRNTPGRAALRCAALLAGAATGSSPAAALEACTVTVGQGESLNEVAIDVFRNNAADVVCLEPGFNMGFPSMNMYDDSGYPLTIQSTGANLSIPGQFVVLEGADLTLINLTFDYAPAYSVPVVLQGILGVGTARAALLVNNATLHLQNVSFESNAQLDAGLVALDSALYLDGVIMQDFSVFRPLLAAFSSGAAATDTLIVQNSSFHDNTGGAIRVVGSGAGTPPAVQIGDPLGATQVSFSVNQASGGADVQAELVSLSVYYANFISTIVTGPMESGYPGAPLVLWGGDGVFQHLLFEDTRQANGTTDSYGAIYSYLAGNTVDMSGIEILRQRHPMAAIKVFADQTDPDIAVIHDILYTPGTILPPLLYAHSVDEVTVSDVFADLGGLPLSGADGHLFHLENTQSARMSGLTLCNLSAGDGLQHVIQAATGSLELHHSHFQNLLMDTSLLYAENDASLQFYNNTFWANRSPAGLVDGAYQRLSFINNIAGEMDEVLNLDQVADGNISYNMLWDNTIGMRGASAHYDGSTHFEENPNFRNYVPTDCLSAPVPAAGSPAEERGHPTLYLDDGAAADLGRYPVSEGGDSGGSDSGSSDSGSSDSGGSSADQDGDGYPAADDCDDGDPSIHPMALDAPNDGVDQDCSGEERQSGLIGGTFCGCGGTAGGAAGAWVLGFGMFLGRRKDDRRQG